jgi:S-DNA-T family DNA segregation ATPase FtsK/SpoIIIE
VWRRSVAPQEPVSIAGAVKDVPDDEVFWHEVVGLAEAAAGSEDVMPDDELSAQAAPVLTLTPEQLARFEAMVLRRSTQSIKIFGAVMAQLPNTVLSRNPFVSVEGQATPYVAVMQALTVPVVAPKKVAAPRAAASSSVYRLPELSLFNQPAAAKTDEAAAAQETGLNDQRARKVEEKLEHFGVNGNIVSIKPGPVVTLFEYKPEIDSKISKIVALEDDLAMALTAHSMRIIAPIPGKNAVGFEIANHTRRDVVVAQVLNNPAFQETKARLPLILGVDALGAPVVEDLTTMPHLLVGGATGSGKSVGLNVMVVSLLCKRSPDDLRLIMIDPKRLEFTPYANIPHLLFPIVTQPSRAASVLSWVVQEMEERYEAMAAVGVRSFDEYRKAFSDKKEKSDANECTVPHRTAYLVVVIDELADLMMVAGKEVEEKIVRIAQMARAAGIHLVVATQRPSVDVVTGLIKVNFPSRVSFRVSSKVDSRTILDQRGAEKLLGRGDMLYMHASSPELRRVHGPYVSDVEIERLTNAIREQRAPQYLDLNEVLKQTAQHQEVSEQDDLYPQLLELVKATDEISISMIQRHYRIGFNRSARLIERLEMDGLLAPAQGSKPRKVLR